MVVVNAEKVRVTGRKPEQKQYYTYSGYPGGLKVQTYRQLMQRHPTRVLKLAVKRMLPKNRLGRKLLRKLHIYAGPRHPHAAQQPKAVEIKNVK